MKDFTTVILCSALIFTSCQTIDGPMFTAGPKPPKGKALVYFYKPVAYGKSIYVLYVNGWPITKLMRGGYFPYYVPPGDLKMVADKHARLGELLEVLDIEPKYKLAFQVDADKVYYVKIQGALFHELVQVDETTALEELSECRRLPKFGNK